LATLYNNKGYNLILLKKYKEAEPLVNKAISLDKKTDYIWGTKGELEYYLGNYSDAVNAMSKSIKIKPTANSYYFRGLAEIKLGNKEKGCSDLSKSGEMGETKAYTEIKNNCN
jgi:tetratricopeptide (TPR) repeat protein